MTPTGKAIYARRPGWYPQGNPALYAKWLGCSFIALNHFASRDEHIQQAHDLELPVYLWSHPASWTPDNWSITLDEMAERVYVHGLRGFIADPETDWQDADRGPLADQLGVAARSLPSVGITSYPSWYIQDFAHVADSGLWASPQLYGIISPESPQELHRRAERWRTLFGSNVVPSLAAWRRSPEEQQSYLDHFKSERGAILWQTATAMGSDGRIQPAPGTAGFEVLRNWQPNGAFGRALLARFVSKVVQPYPFGRLV